MKKIVLILSFLVGITQGIAKEKDSQCQYVPLKTRTREIQTSIKNDPLLRGVTVYSNTGIIFINWVRRKNEIVIICNAKYFNGNEKIEYYYGKKTFLYSFFIPKRSRDEYSSWCWKDSTDKVSFKFLLSGTKPEEISWMNMPLVNTAIKESNFVYYELPKKTDIKRIKETEYLKENEQRAAANHKITGQR